LLNVPTGRYVSFAGGRGVDHVRLGQSGLKVSQVCLGTANFGTAWGLGVDETGARPIIDAFLDAGHNFIDTANNYHDGQSEQIVGRALRGRRDSVVVATKAFMPQGPGPNDAGLSRVHLTRALEASLRRLGTDYIDLYQCHKWDPDTPIDETMATLDGFVRSGKVRYIGCSNITASQIVEAQWAAARVSGVPFVSLQSQYSLLRRDIEAEILPTCARHGLGTLAWSPLGGGILAGRYRPGADPDPETRLGRLITGDFPGALQWVRGQLSERNLEIVAEVAKAAAELGVTSAAVAIAWLCDRPGVASVIIGPRTTSQYEQNMAGFGLTLPDEWTARLDEVSGPAPAPVTGTTERPWLRFPRVRAYHLGPVGAEVGDPARRDDPGQHEAPHVAEAGAHVAAADAGPPEHLDADADGDHQGADHVGDDAFLQLTGPLGAAQRGVDGTQELDVEVHERPAAVTALPRGTQAGPDDRLAVEPPGQHVRNVDQ
jgi:aryl-alcohol dehydrogenase-like predicted oxidoreductase